MRTIIRLRTRLSNTKVAQIAFERPDSALSCGLELRHPGRSKGDVMRELLEEQPSGTISAYVGDDETDEDAFRALAGRGLAVLVAEQPRETAAEHVIPHEGVGPLLEAWLEQAGCGQ